MYTRILVPLDGSTVAEQVLPYARFMAKALTLPVELLEVIDPDELRFLVNPEQGRYIDTLLADRTASDKHYLERIARSFQGSHVQCFIENGRAEEAVIEKAATDKNTLIAMATHGRSGFQRWVLGSVAEKVVHGATNHVLLIRATEHGETSGEATLKTVIVPLDGSPVAEQVLPHTADLAKKMKLKIVLLRAYGVPPAITAEEYGTYVDELYNQLEREAGDYLAEKVEELSEKVWRVSPIS
jgi:nucleotide-binding universal stress UspA family protein